MSLPDLTMSKYRDEVSRNVLFRRHNAKLNGGSRRCDGRANVLAIRYIASCSISLSSPVLVVEHQMLIDLLLPNPYEWLELCAPSSYHS